MRARPRTPPEPGRRTSSGLRPPSPSRHGRHPSQVAARARPPSRLRPLSAQDRRSSEPAVAWSSRAGARSGRPRPSWFTAISKKSSSGSILPPHHNLSMIFPTIGRPPASQLSASRPSQARDTPPLSRRPAAAPRAARSASPRRPAATPPSAPKTPQPTKSPFTFISHVDNRCSLNVKGLFPSRGLVAHGPCVSRTSAWRLETTPSRRLSLRRLDTNPHAGRHAVVRARYPEPAGHRPGRAARTARPTAARACVKSPDVGAKNGRSGCPAEAPRWAARAGEKNAW